MDKNMRSGALRFGAEPACHSVDRNQSEFLLAQSHSVTFSN